MTTIDPTKLVRNKELESIVPHLTEEKFKELKEAIWKNPKHVEVPIIIGTIDDVVNTIIDGYNRHKAVMELVKEGKLTVVYEIPVSESPIVHLQIAKEYSIEINLKRRQLDTYQTVTWALSVYGSTCTEKEIERKIGIKQQSINQIKGLNSILYNHVVNVGKMSEIAKGLQNGDIGYREAAKQLQNALVVDNAIAVLSDKKFQKEMEEKYADIKYTTSKNVIKQLEEDTYKHDHPEQYAKAENTYHKEFNTIFNKIEKLEHEHDDKVAIITVASDDKFKEASDWLLEQRGTGKRFSCVVFFEVPEDSVS